MTGPIAAQVLRRYFRLIGGFCIGPSIKVSETKAPPTNLDEVEGDNDVEHIMDVGVVLF
jgi:hypothetical protein